jgi:hypothetical protein
MVAEVFAGLGAFKMMLDTAKTLKDMNDAAVRNAAVIELQGQILSAQEQQATLIQQVQALEKRVADFDRWQVEEARYQLTELPPRIYVYSLKPEMAQGEPKHQICQKCYQHRRKSILHASEESEGTYTLTCHECGIILQVGHYSPRPLPRRHWSAT